MTENTASYQPLTLSLHSSRQTQCSHISWSPAPCSAYTRSSLLLCSASGWPQCSHLQFQASCFVFVGLMLSGKYYAFCFDAGCNSFEALVLLFVLLLTLFNSTFQFVHECSLQIFYIYFLQWDSLTPYWPQFCYVDENDFELLLLLLQVMGTMPSLCGARNGTQGSGHDRQALCPMSYIPDSSLLFCIG